VTFGTSLVIGVAPLTSGLRLFWGYNVKDAMRMIMEQEDVKRIIREREAENAYLSMIAPYGWPCHRQFRDYKSHQQRNDEIVKKLNQFLLAPTEFESSSSYGVRGSVETVWPDR
jgi:hypothetical protein